MDMDTSVVIPRGEGSTRGIDGNGKLQQKMNFLKVT